jgi:hypothetical protein
MRGWLSFQWWWVGMRVRYFWRESLPWAIAMRLPRRVALFAFVRVYAVIGECGPDYKRVYDAWESK